ncbi:MAG: hypothetical protein RLY69_7 [Verrucomicrobiota bacterium]
MRFAVLGSGSGGNSAVIECNGVRLLLDAGLSAKQLTTRMQSIGVDPASLDGILITHEHGDHVKGLDVFLRKNQVPVYTTAATRLFLHKEGMSSGTWKIFEAGREFQIGDALITSFTVQHDAVDPVGYVIGDGRKKIGIASDMGHVTRSVTERLRDLDGLFVEANYDKNLLDADMRRPWSTKQRISSPHGHLSNDQVADLLREIAHPRLSQVVFGHLSGDCNRKDLVISRLRDCLDALGHAHIGLHCAEQDQPTDWFAV